MQIKKNISLAPFTTFHIGGPAKYYAEVNNINELKQALDFVQKNNLELFLLGRGSNILVSDRGFQGLVLHLNIFGIEKMKDGENFILLKIGANEVFDRVVKSAVEKNFWGIENLSGIPGSVGAAPVQNIGAYGQEISNVIDYIEAYDQKLNKLVKLTNKQCQFGYRKSIFNTTDKGRYFIFYVILKLNKYGRPNIKYPDAVKYFKEKNIKNPTLNQTREAILKIRQKKFAKQVRSGTAGSFFKNLIINNKDFDLLENRLKALSYKNDYQHSCACPPKPCRRRGRENPVNEILNKLEEIKKKFLIDDKIKIPTAFIIDKICNLKGLQVGKAKVSEKQALEIVNINSKATADDIMQVFKKVRQIVYKQTGQILENEPQLVGFTQKELDDYFKLPKC